MPALIILAVVLVVLVAGAFGLHLRRSRIRRAAARVVPGRQVIAGNLANSRRR